ncbi:unnamed protein product [Darwinula stevensoni]|uniref:Uncharacterized protein n=1 Tax=Darwinula stevensoni TaxID=69355 RepID=A0A7R8XFL5_9CRUS|nr:unnamed protein product [Darwinula stevensoni]CAG0890814.1 unnamed protein product [Darwinula stevensoni]
MARSSHSKHLKRLHAIKRVRYAKKELERLKSVLEKAKQDEKEMEALSKIADLVTKKGEKEDSTMEVEAKKNVKGPHNYPWKNPKKLKKMEKIRRKEKLRANKKKKSGQWLP